MRKSRHFAFVPCSAKLLLGEPVHDEYQLLCIADRRFDVYMDPLRTIGGASAHSVLQVTSGANELMVGRPVAIHGAKTSYLLHVDESTQTITLSGRLQASESNTTAAAGASVEIGSGEKLWAALNRGAHTPPQRLQLTVAEAVAKASNKIKVRWPYPVLSEALLAFASIQTVNGVGLSTNASIGTFTTVSGTIASKDLVIELTLAGTDVTVEAIAADELVEIDQVDDTEIGYGLKGVATPVISATSDWGATVKIFEVQSIAEAMFRSGVVSYGRRSTGRFTRWRFQRDSRSVVARPCETTSRVCRRLRQYRRCAKSVSAIVRNFAKEYCSV